MRRRDLLIGAILGTAVFVGMSFATRGWVFGRALGVSLVAAAAGAFIGTAVSDMIRAIRYHLAEVRRLERETAWVEYPSLRLVDPAYRHQLADPETFWREIEVWRSA